MIKNQEHSDLSSETIEALVLQQAGLVKRIAHHMCARMPPNILVDDLIQAGMIGLLDAATHYDASKGASFETYAGIRIRGMMIDEVRRHDWVPRSVHRNGRAISEKVREIENKTGREAKDQDVAQSLGITLTEYHAMLVDMSGSRLFGLEELYILETSDDDSIEPMAGLAPDPFEGVQRELFKEKLVEAIKGLPEREQMVLSLYYEEEMNLKEIGLILNVSESRVCQIHSQAMFRLQARIQDWNIK